MKLYSCFEREHTDQTHTCRNICTALFKAGWKIYFSYTIGCRKNVFIHSTEWSGQKSKMLTRLWNIAISLIARFMGPTWAHLGPTGPRWAPAHRWAFGVYCGYCGDLRKVIVLWQYRIVFVGNDKCYEWRPFFYVSWQLLHWPTYSGDRALKRSFSTCRESLELYLSWIWYVFKSAFFWHCFQPVIWKFVYVYQFMWITNGALYLWGRR